MSSKVRENAGTDARIDGVPDGRISTMTTRAVTGIAVSPGLSPALKKQMTQFPSQAAAIRAAQKRK
jgi:hypothetical protein